MARRMPAERAVEAADALTAWLDGFVVAMPRSQATPDRMATTSGADGAGAGEGASGDDRAARPSGRPRARSDLVDARERVLGTPAAIVAAEPGPVAAGDVETVGSGKSSRPAAEVLRLANPDWLEHHLAVSGPVDVLARFRAAAAGPGVIPWHYNLDGAEEDLFHRLVAPPAPHPRVLSAVGAHIMAGELRDAMERQHAMALSRVGRSRACPFDLHALLPVPDEVLALGPDHPEALAWLWEHWGTTLGLRRIEVIPALRSRVRLPEEVAAQQGQAAFHLGFWSADWTPWRALADLAETWPVLRFQVCPLYDRESG